MKKRLLHLFITLLFTNICFGQIVITEIYFNALGVNDSDYIEIYNNSNEDINLESYRFAQGFEYVFPDMIFQKDSYLILTVHGESLMETLGVEGIQWTSGTLDNVDIIQLVDPMGTEVDYLAYDVFTNPDWTPFTAGTGYGFQLCDVNSDNELASNWQITNNKLIESGDAVIYGTPGHANTCVDLPLIAPSNRIARIIESETPKTAIFAFLLTNSNGMESSLNLNIDPASTASADDYIIINTEVSFDGTEDSFLRVEINSVDDDIVEGPESLIFNIEEGDNTALSIIDQIEVIIYDNDSPLDQGMVLISVFDALDTDEPDNFGVELYALKDIPDLSKYSIGIANNGGGTDGIEIPLPSISLNKNDNFFISDSKVRFENFFGIESDFSHPSIQITGDDAIELFENGVVIDIYGQIDVDGTNTDWDYTNGWAKRKSDTGPDGTEFVRDHWRLSTINVLIGPTNDQCILPFPLDFFIYTSTDEINAKNQFEIIPTLAHGNLSVRFSKTLKSGIIEITDGQGGIVLQQNLVPDTENLPIDIQQFSSGIYYLTVKTSSGVYTKKFVKL